ncbi:MAG TPA: histidine kinase [Tangfeifania sp.]|nr:histidine kinase [Tangfeifania sp.]
MVRKLKIAIRQFVKNRVLQHILFWCLSFLVLLNILKVSSDVKQIDLIYTAIFHVPIILIVYLNLKVLFPGFLEKGKYILYGALVLTLVVFGSGFYILLFGNWIDYIFTGYYFIAYYSFWDISLYLIVYISLTSLLRLARGWFRLQEMQNEKTETELKALRSQINPHFLFNSLNSIYSLARKNSDLVPEKVVQLSDLMRHVIYESDTDAIPLEKEIEMIRNYIELQNLRTPDSEKIKLEVLGDLKEKKIAPLLFLPFVENSFKHGLKGGGNMVFVSINIRVQENSLLFEIENSKGKNTEIKEEKYKGIGIENVRKRLDLIYPGKYSLEISDDEFIFKVTLNLQLN